MTPGPGTAPLLPAGPRHFLAIVGRKRLERASEVICRRERSVAPPASRPQTDYTEYEGRLQMARKMADPEVLTDMG